MNSGPRAGKWVYCPIVRAKNKSIKLHWASADGEEELHEEGVYRLLFRHARKQCKEVVEAVQDLLAQVVKEKKSELEAIANGHKTVAAGVKTEERSAQRPLAVSVKTYLEKVKTLKGEKTYDTHSTAARHFTMSCMDMDLKNAKVGDEAEKEFDAMLVDCKLSWDDVKDEVTS